MMPFAFWKSWNRTERLFLYLLMGLVLASLVLAMVAKYQGLQWVFPLQSDWLLESVPVVMDSYRQGLYSRGVTADSFVLLERFGQEDMTIPVWVWYVALGLSSVAVALFLAAISTLRQFWFWVGLGFWSLFVWLIRLDALQMRYLGELGGWALWSLAGAALAWYLNEKRAGMLYPWRVLWTWGLLLGLGTLSFFLAQVANPPMVLFSYGLWALVLGAVVFILAIGIDFQVFTAVSLANQKNGLTNFLVFNLLYLGNLLLVHLHNRSVITWDLYYLDAYWVLAGTAILGLWMFARKEDTYDYLFPFRSIGTGVYLGGALLTFALVFFVQGLANDPLVEALEDAVILGHLSFGAAFTFYIFINFSGVYGQTDRFIRILWEGVSLRPIMMRFIGAVILVVLVVNAQRVSLFQAQAGYEFNLGSLYLGQNSMDVAKTCYERGNDYILLSFHGNAALAHIYRNEGYEKEFLAARRMSFLKNTPDYAFAGLANWFQDRERHVEALVTLQEGLKKHPQSSRLLSNLVIAFAKAGEKDSARAYLPRLLALVGPNDATFAANESGLSAWLGLPQRDTTFVWETEEAKLSLTNNRLVAATAAGKAYRVTPQQARLRDSALSIVDFCLLYNAGLNRAVQRDSSLASVLEFYRFKQANSPYSDKLFYATALMRYYAGDRLSGLRMMARLGENPSDRRGLYAETAGKWLVGVQNWKRAADLYQAAREEKRPGGRNMQAFSTALAGKPELAAQIWEEGFAFDEDSSYLEQAALAVRLSPQQVLQLSEESRLKFLQLRRAKLAVSDLQNLYNSLSEANSRQIAASLVMEELLNRNLSDAAYTVWENAQAIPNTDPWPKRELNYWYLRMVLQDGQWQELSQALPTMPLNEDRASQIPFFRAVALEKLGGTPAETEKAWREALSLNPGVDFIALPGIDYLVRIGKKDQAYQILIDETEVNPYSPELQKVYILQSLERNLLFFADLGLERLKTITSEADYDSFALLYEQQKKARLGLP